MKNNGLLAKNSLATSTIVLMALWQAVRKACSCWSQWVLPQQTAWSLGRHVNVLFASHPSFLRVGVSTLGMWQEPAFARKPNNILEPCRSDHLLKPFLWRECVIHTQGRKTGSNLLSLSLSLSLSLPLCFLLWWLQTTNLGAWFLASSFCIAFCWVCSLKILAAKRSKVGRCGFRRE